MDDAINDGEGKTFSLNIKRVELKLVSILEYLVRFLNSICFNFIYFSSSILGVLIGVASSGTSDGCTTCL